MKVQFTALMVILAMMILSGCSKKDNITDGNNSNTNNEQALSEQQEMELVASQVSASSGGAMMDVATAGATSDGALYSLAKLDTTINYGWVTYKALFSFYKQNGSEMPFYLAGVTDSITANTSLSGDKSFASIISVGATWSLNLNRNAQLQVGHILSNTIIINGSSTDQSHYAYNGSIISLDVQLDCSFSMENIIVPLDSPYYIPTSGAISGELAGTIERPNASKEVHIPYTIIFDGDETATITLENRSITFSVNLLTGVIYL